MNTVVQQVPGTTVTVGMPNGSGVAETAQAA